MTYNLNRIQCFENHISFPKIILKALVHTCGVSVTDNQIEEREREIFNYVRNFKREVHENFEKIDSDDGLLKIADFIGNQRGWTNKESLLKALKHIIIFNDNLNLNDSLNKEDKLIISYKNSENVYACDIIMAYKYCLEKKINIEKDDKKEDIEDKINSYLNQEKENKEMEKELLEIKIQEEEKVKIEEEKINILNNEEEITSLKNSNRNKEEEITSLRNSNRNKEEEITSLRNSNRNKEEEINSLKNSNEEKITSLKNIISDKEYEINSLKNSNRNNNEEEINNLKTIITDKEYEINSLKNNNNEEEINNLKTIISDKEYEINSLKNSNRNNNFNNINNKLINRFLNQDNKKIDLLNLENFLKEPILNLIISKTLLTNEEAIFIGIRLFAFDLRESPQPYEDLLQLNEHKKSQKTYLPDKDRKDNFTKNLHMNKNYYSLDRYYKQELKEFYSAKTINDLLEEYSLTKEEGLNKLEEIYNTNNFHRGWLKGDNYKFINDKNILSFGMPGKIIMNFNADDLLEYFKTKGNRDPITNRILTDSQIERLKILSKKLNLENLENSFTKKELKDDNDINSFINKYLFASDLIDKLLDDFFRMGMFIRGWKSSGLTYPLQKKDCLIYDENKHEIDENVKRVIRDFNYNFDKIKDIGIKNNFKRLPIIDYQENEFIYQGNKLEKLLEAFKDIENINMKNLSNQLILSAYYYFFATSSKKIFQINSLELL